MLKLFIPKHILVWLDGNRGTSSRSAYIIDLLCKIKEEGECG